MMTFEIVGKTDFHYFRICLFFIVILLKIFGVQHLQ